MSRQQESPVRIRITDCDVGILGLKEAIQEIADSHTNSSDSEIESALLERLGSRNYIADSARDEYGKAFLREFKKFVGLPYQEEAGGGLSVVILGPGCSQCNRLEQLAQSALIELNLPASLEHVTDLKEISNYGFVPTPALVINGRIVSKGSVPNINKIKEWFRQSSHAQDG